MKKYAMLFMVVATMCSSALAKVDLVTLPDRDTVQLTIYNSADMTLVRESRGLTLKQGRNRLQFSWANTLIDPTSLEMLAKANVDKIDISDLTFPPRVRNLGLWNINSEVSGRVPIEITYLTSGLTWRAFYMGTLTKDEKTMRMQAYIRVTNNSGEEYGNAQTRLIVGKVHLLDAIANLARRQHPYGRPTPLEKDHGVDHYYGYATKEDKAIPLLGDMAQSGVLFKKLADLEPREVKKEGLSEYFLYTIEGKDTIANGWSKRLPSFDIEDVPVEHLYKYDEDRFGGGVVRFLSFANDEDHELGDTPIPGGSIKVYRNIDSAQHLAYTGQSAFKYIPVDEDVELNLGTVSDVVVKPALMDYRTENYRFDSRKNICGWDEIGKWTIEVRNTRDLPVEVEITRNFGTTYWDIETGDEGYSYEKHDASHGRFELKLAARTKTTIEYTVTKYNGTRREEINQ